MSQLKAKNGKRHWKYLSFLLDKSMHSSRAVCALWFFSKKKKKLSSTAPPTPPPPPHSNNNNRKNTGQSQLNWIDHVRKQNQRADILKFVCLCVCVCVCECVCCCRLSWDRKAFNLPRKRRTEKREISNNSSHKWKRVKWFCFQLFVHSDNFCTRRDHHVWACVKRRKRETEKQREREKDGK